MPLLPHFAKPNDFAPLFRFIDDDYSAHTLSHQQQTAGPRSTTPSSRHVIHFTPHFDVRDIEDGYELYGELPGVDSKNVNVEFTEDNTVTISGRTERRSIGPNNGEDVMGKDKKATVEDAPEEENNNPEKHDPTAPTVEDNDKAMAHHHQHKLLHKQHNEWLITERNFGSFSRTFQFQAPVDKNAVTAGLKNGVLVVVVPKRKEKPNRKVVIDVE